MHNPCALPLCANPTPSWESVRHSGVRHAAVYNIMQYVKGHHNWWCSNQNSCQGQAKSSFQLVRVKLLISKDEEYRKAEGVFSNNSREPRITMLALPPIRSASPMLSAIQCLKRTAIQLSHAKMPLMKL